MEQKQWAERARQNSLRQLREMEDTFAAANLARLRLGQRTEVGWLTFGAGNLVAGGGGGVHDEGKGTFCATRGGMHTANQMILRPAWVTAS